MNDQPPALRLDAPRDEVLDQATEIIRAAWRSFDQARPGQPSLDDRVRALLDAPLPEQPTAAAEALRDTAQVLDESLAPNRPRYFAFVGSSGLEIGVVADALAACFDVNLASYGGAATPIEREVLRWVAEFVGFPGHAGAVTSGGTVSNITALAAARERAVPGSRQRGLRDVLPKVYASIDAHDSVERAVEVLGIGSDGLVALPVDAERRLDVAALERAIAADIADGATPIAVVANAGSTLAGAVDPLDAIADVCARHGVWLHVDGAYGLPAAATASAAPLFRGLDRADSVSVDAHKWMYLPKACGVVLIHDERALAAAFAHDADYMLRTGEQWNPVDLTLEYSRPFRPLKLWLAFRVHGAAAFREALERNLAQARLLADEIRRHDDLELLVEPQLTVVPFRHVPPGVEDLDTHNRLVADAIQAEANIYLAAATYDGVVGLRPCIVNYRTTDDDVRAIVEHARAVGARVAAGTTSPAPAS
jgi:aromatic-L-amino-acid decarboxylase